MHSHLVDMQCVGCKKWVTLRSATAYATAERGCRGGCGRHGSIAMAVLCAPRMLVQQGYMPGHKQASALAQLPPQPWWHLHGSAAQRRGSGTAGSSTGGLAPGTPRHPAAPGCWGTAAAAPARAVCCLLLLLAWPAALLLACAAAGPSCSSTRHTLGPRAARLPARRLVITCGKQVLGRAGLPAGPYCHSRLGRMQAAAGALLHRWLLGWPH